MKIIFIVLYLYSTCLYSCNVEIYVSEMKKYISECKKDESLLPAKFCKIIRDKIAFCGKPSVIKTNNKKIFFFNLVSYQSGSTTLDDSIMKPILEDIIDTIKEIKDDINITVIGYTDLQKTKPEADFQQGIDDSNLCTNEGMDRNSNICLSLIRAKIISNYLDDIIKKIPKNNITINPSCYSQDYLLRDINSFLKGKVWGKFKIEKKLALLLKSDVGEEKFKSFFSAEPISSNKMINKIREDEDIQKIIKKETILKEFYLFRSVVVIIEDGKKQAKPKYIQCI